MKKSILALTLISALGVGSVFAADTAAVNQSVDQLKSQYNLNENQTQRINNIITRASMTDEELKAQRDAKMAERMDDRLANMKEKLGLTDEQVTQLKTIMTEQHGKIEAIHTETQTRVNGVLTPEQVEKMKTFRGGRGMGMGMEGGPDGKGRHGGGHHRGGHGSDWGDKAGE